MNKIILFIKRNKYVYAIIHELYFKAKRLLLYFFWVFPVKKNRIVCISYYGKYYSDNPKAISDKLLNIEAAEIIWIVDEPYKYDTSNVKFVKTGSLKMIYMLATAGVWIDNCRKEEWIRKRKEQYYIQTYHAAIPFKCVEGDAESLLDKKYVKAAKNDGKMADLMISNSKWCSDMIRRAFWFSGEILESGSPRLDGLINLSDNRKQEIKKQIGISDKKTKIILYAPTFRNNHSLDVYDLNYRVLCETLKEKTGVNWVILLRLHFGMTQEAKRIEDKNIINVTEYNDIYELLGIADVFITDYSTTMLEAALAEKPVFIYASDIESYMRERHTYFKFSELPFMVSTDTEELINNIIMFNRDEYITKKDNFFKQLNVCETGMASKIVADKIKNILKID